jgi:protein phosphatase
MSTKQSTVRAACVSDVGHVRSSNQDRCAVLSDLNLFVVADGMGGHQAGEIAAEAVVELLPSMLDHRLRAVSSLRPRIIELVLRETIVALSQRLWTESVNEVDLRGMGTTVALALLHNGHAYLANMGDSRIYLFRAASLTQLTEDHSVVAMLLKYGNITSEEAAHHPARGKLSRYVGMEQEVYPDIKKEKLYSHDRLLLCSDGLTRMVPDAYIARILQQTADPESACQALVDAANAAGGKDNVTALILDWRAVPQT